MCGKLENIIKEKQKPHPSCKHSGLHQEDANYNKKKTQATINLLNNVLEVKLSLITQLKLQHIYTFI